MASAKRARLVRDRGEGPEQVGAINLDLNRSLDAML
jgi:hypothetical protein